jgi:hypothetical protein
MNRQIIILLVRVKCIKELIQSNYAVAKRVVANVQEVCRGVNN